MQHATGQEPSRNLEMSLREHLLAAGASGSGPPPYPSSSAAPSSTDVPTYQPSDSASPHDHYDLNVGGPNQGASYGMSGDSAGDETMSPDARKGKRELSTSKRAAQNRAAQRAFRQRKEGYIRKLEDQVKDYERMEENYRGLQNENYQLREYILNLQSRLLENQSDFPPPPMQVNLSTSNADATATAKSAVEQHLRRELQQPSSTSRDGISQLQAAAAQASNCEPTATGPSARDSPYALAGETYSKKRSRGEDEVGGEAKLAS